MTRLPVCRFGVVAGRAASVVFSPDRRYRYWLAREESRTDAKRMLFVMLNPSDADETRDDATVRRCIRFADREGCPTLEIVNLFGLVAHNPRRLIEADDPVGPDNDAHTRVAFAAFDGRPEPVVVAAWGTNAARSQLRARVAAVLDIADRIGIQWHALGDLTNGGHPRHPLYLPASAPLRPVHLTIGEPHVAR